MELSNNIDDGLVEYTLDDISKFRDILMNIIEYGIDDIFMLLKKYISLNDRYYLIAEEIYNILTEHNFRIGRYIDDDNYKEKGIIYTIVMFYKITNDILTEHERIHWMERTIGDDYYDENESYDEKKIESLVELMYYNPEIEDYLNTSYVDDTREFIDKYIIGIFYDCDVTKIDDICFDFDLIYEREEHTIFNDNTNMFIITTINHFEQEFNDKIDELVDECHTNVIDISSENIREEISNWLKKYNDDKY